MRASECFTADTTRCTSSAKGQPQRSSITPSQETKTTTKNKRDIKNKAKKNAPLSAYKRRGKSKKKSRRYSGSPRREGDSATTTFNLYPVPQGGQEKKKEKKDKREPDDKNYPTGPQVEPSLSHYTGGEMFFSLNASEKGGEAPRRERKAGKKPRNPNEENPKN